MKKVAIISTALAATLGAVVYTQLPGSAQFASGSFNCQAGQVVNVTHKAPDAIEYRCAPGPTPSPVSPTPTATPALIGLFVSPTGKPTAAGTQADPLDLATALKPGKAQPGQTIWLRAGTYALPGAKLTGTETPPFSSRLNGTAAAVITVRGYPGERAIIDGGIQIEAGTGYTIWRDFEVSNSSSDRTQARPTAMNVLGHHVKLINLVIHDAGNGIGLWSSAPDSEVYGCIIYRNGWEAVGDYRGHGHGGYFQSEIGDKLIQHNIVFDNYAMGLKAYGEAGFVRGITYDGNISFDNGSPARPQPKYNRMENLFFGAITNPMQRIVATNNYTYHALDKQGNNARFAYSVKNSTDVTIKDNYFAGGSEPFILYEWLKATVEGNTIVGAGHLASVQMPAGATYGFKGNAYYTVGASTLTPFMYAAPGRALTPLKWDAYRTAAIFDTGGAWSQVANTAAMSVKVGVLPNKHEQGRAHVVVYWANGRTVEIDLSKVLRAGQAFEILNVKDLGKPILSGVYDNKPASLSIAGEFAALLVRGKGQ